jgi:hypothetical protein
MEECEEEIDDTINRLSDMIPKRLHLILEQTLVLQEVERKHNLSLPEVYDWRGEIANMYKNRGNDPEEALNFISLCSAGYLDEGGLFDNMYEDMVEEGDCTKDEYKHELTLFINKLPFVEFTNANANVDDVCGRIETKLDMIYEWNWSPGFVDVAGKGEDNHEKVEKVADRVSEDFDGEIRRKENTDIEELLIRFEPNYKP